MKEDEIVFKEIANKNGKYGSKSEGWTGII
jgi:hypothetical protein